MTRSRPLILCTTVSVVACGVLGISGCGRGAGARPVARVQSAAISKSALLHWMAPKRIELEAASPARVPSETVVREETLRFLITTQWLEQEAAAQGATVAASETEALYAHLLSGPSGSEFAASLRRRGLSRADELEILRIGELAERLRAKISAPLRGASPTAVRARVQAFLVAYRARWRQRTTCEPGYVIAECRNGSPSPRRAETGA